MLRMKPKFNTDLLFLNLDDLLLSFFSCSLISFQQQNHLVKFRKQKPPECKQHRQLQTPRCKQNLPLKVFSCTVTPFPILCLPQFACFFGMFSPLSVHLVTLNELPQVLLLSQPGFVHAGVTVVCISVCNAQSFRIHTVKHNALHINLHVLCKVTTKNQIYQQKGI